MDASQLPKGKSMERTADGRPLNAPGVYRHKETGAEFTTSDGEEGVIQADALMAPVWHSGWERVGDVPTRVEQLELRKAQLLKDTAAEKAEATADEAKVEALAAKGK